MATVKSEFNLPDGNGGFNKHHLETELAQIEDIVRKPSTQYAADVIKFVAGLPTGWYLECTTGGETASTDITLPASPSIGDTITDGTVTWTIRKIGSGGDGVPLGAIIAYSANGELPSGYLLCDGSAVSRTMFPDLFACIGTTYGAGDGSTTFNLPDYNTAQRFAQGSTVAGTVKSAGLPNITGGISGYYDFAGGHTPVTRGALFKNELFGNQTGSSGGGYNLGLGFDASRSSAIYGNSNTVQPPALTARYIIKAFDAQTADSALIDITQYAQELAGKANKALDNLSADGENHFLENDFAIIYPNGGSEASPANITYNTRYVETNPFPGYRVKCELEILYNGNWGSPETMEIASSGQSKYAGVRATQFNDDAIVIQSLDNGLMGPSTSNGSAFNYNSNLANYLKTAPCRIKVWKIGKIPTA